MQSPISPMDARVFSRMPSRQPQLPETSLKFSICTLAAALALSFTALQVLAQTKPARDEFFWLGEINKASAVINIDEGLLDRSMGPLVYSGITKVLVDGGKPG